MTHSETSEVSLYVAGSSVLPVFAIDLHTSPVRLQQLSCVAISMDHASAIYAANCMLQMILFRSSVSSRLNALALKLFQPTSCLTTGPFAVSKEFKLHNKR